MDIKKDIFFYIYTLMCVVYVKILNLNITEGHSNEIFHRRRYLTLTKWQTAITHIWIMIFEGRVIVKGWVVLSS